MSALVLMCTALALMPASARAAEVTAFVGGTVIDGTGRAPLGDAVVMVREGRIAALGRAGEVPVPDGATRIDVSGKWLIPGLIDAHVHLFQSGGLYTRPDIIDLRRLRPYKDEIARIRAALPATFARYLAAGVTGIVDMGGPMWNFEARRLAAASPLAPRVAVAGPLLATMAPPQLAGEDPPIVLVTTPEDARTEVRRQLAHEPDLIKLWLVFPPRDLGPVMSWVRAAIDESHRAGVRVVAHATQRRLAKAVVEAGVDILAHSISDEMIDERLLGLMLDRGVSYTTTFVVHEGYGEVLSGNVSLSAFEARVGDPDAIASFRDLAGLPKGLLPLWPLPSAPRPTNPVVAANLARAAEAGVTIAAGSDAGNIGTLHGPALHRELELLVRDGGFDPLVALSAASFGGARVMGRSFELGTLEVGKLADMVILDADPLRDIRNTRRIHRVVKEGAILDPAELVAGANSTR